MKQLRCALILIFGIIVVVTESRAEVASAPAAQKLNLYYEQEYVRSHFLLGVEGVTIASGKASLLGGGPKVGFEYGLSPRFSMGANMVFALQATGGNVGAYFYSGLSGLLKYSVFGSAIKVTDRVSQMSRAPLYTGKVIAQRRFCVNLGLEQLFLNGTASIYPAVGSTLGATWGGILFGYEVELDARVGKLIANDNPLSMVGIGANINLDFM
jgi:hypothetical protein